MQVGMSLYLRGLIFISLYMLAIISSVGNVHIVYNVGDVESC